MRFANLTESKITIFSFFVLITMHVVFYLSKKKINRITESFPRIAQKNVQFQIGCCSAVQISGKRFHNFHGILKNLRTFIKVEIYMNFLKFVRINSQRKFKTQLVIRQFRYFKAPNALEVLQNLE